MVCKCATCGQEVDKRICKNCSGDLKYSKKEHKIVLTCLKCGEIYEE
jgi:DNA-directed RNA polymerase subunit M/transcription elongation factor TFIIS